MNCPGLVLQTECLLVVGVKYVPCWSIFAGLASSRRTPVCVLYQRLFCDVKQSILSRTVRKCASKPYS